MNVDVKDDCEGVGIAVAASVARGLDRQRAGRTS
jgi:hypothetical protein